MDNETLGNLKKKKTKSVFLTDKPCKFLMALTKPNKTPLVLGREIYTANSSVYGAIDEFEQLGLIEVTKGGRDLSITLTPLGKQKLFHIHGLWDCKI